MLDCEIYVDSEEDEVFFGNFNEQEKKIGSNLIDNLVLKSRFEKASNSVENSDHVMTNIFSGTYGENDFTKEIDKISENLSESTIYSCPTTVSNNEMNSSFDSEEQFHSLHSNNASVELDHNYSFTKQKIDESILSTPKSIVKADKDGGFLKVLSEIALVKAEADFKLEVDKKKGSTEKNNVFEKEDEDKENRICVIPEIRVIEATPEKPFCTTSIENFTKLQFKKSETSSDSSFLDNLDKKHKNTIEALTQNKVTILNSKKNYSKFGSKENLFAKTTETKMETIKKSRRNSWPNLMDQCNDHIEVIDVTDESIIEDEVNKTFKHTNSFSKITELQNQSANKDDCVIIEMSSNCLESSTNLKNLNNQSYNDGMEDVKIYSVLEKQVDCSIGNHEFDNTEFSDNLLINKEKSFNLNIKPLEVDIKESSKTTLKEKTINTSKILLPENNFSADISNDLNIDKLKSKEENFTFKTKPITPVISKTLQKLKKNSETCRFSKEAKKIVEALKTFTVNDSLNFTIPEINIEEIENSFLSPDPVSTFDATLMSSNDYLMKSDISSSFKSSGESNQLKVDEKKTDVVAKTPQTKLGPLKYFSDKKQHYGTSANEIKKSFKELSTPYNIKILSKSEQSCGKRIETKIPVSVNRTKFTNIPSNCLTKSVELGEPNLTPYKRNAKFAKTNSCKNFSGNHPKTSKFKNVASPIGAYIHNKPTALVVNIKPQNKKDGFLSSIKNSQNRNVEDKPAKTPNRDLGLPFVEYKSATPFKIEKRPEKHLPRLAPAVERLIGTNSPKVLKHKGRFYIKAPGKKDSSNVDSTIMADKNEVSVVVSQVAQKSSTLN